MYGTGTGFYTGGNYFRPSPDAVREVSVAEPENGASHPAIRLVIVNGETFLTSSVGSSGLREVTHRLNRKAAPFTPRKAAES